MAPKVFIDGDVGTTGLQIRARLAGRRDIELLRLDESERKDAQRRAAMLNAADVAILCLPDDAAREAVAMIEGGDTRVVDASTAHRVNPDWVFGFPEMAPGQEAQVAAAKRVSNPGCYPTGMIALVRPLVEEGLVPAGWPVTVNAVSGYTGGGKSLIARFEDAAAPDAIHTAFHVYGLGLEHKHVEEMRVHGLLDHRPLFVPSVGRFAQGMIVQVPLQLWALPGAPTPARIRELLADRFAGQPFVSVASEAETAAVTNLDAESLNGSNDLRLHVFGNEKRGQAVLAAVLDNLGKGASGAAVQNMNLMLGLDPRAGLEGRLAA